MLMLALCALVAADGDDNRIKLAVLSLKTDEPSAAIGTTIVDLVSSRLDREGVFQVITEDDVKQMVNFDQMKTALSCDEQASCLAEIGQALGVGYIMTGTLAQLGGRHVLTMVLIDIQNARPLKRESASYASVDELMAGLDKQVERTVAGLLYSQKGKLLVDCSEEGATVELDGKALGTTPFAEQEVPSGPHRVSVTKAGFIQFAQDVTIRPREQTFLKATLQPSPQFIADYRLRTGAVRTAAWGTAIGAGASALVGAGGFAWAFARFEQLAQAPSSTRDADGNVHTSEIEPYVEINASWFTGIGGMVAALALATTSTWLFVTGEDPDRYGSAE